MACVAVLSLMRTLELEFLQPHPRPILQQNELILPNKDLIQFLHGKLKSLIELFDENRMDGVEAIKHLETRLRDVAFSVEDEIELQVVHLYAKTPQGDTQGCSMPLCQIFHRAKGEAKGDNDVETICPSLRLGHILQQAIEDIDAIEEELVKVKEEYEHSKDLHGRKAALDDGLPNPDEVITMMGDSSHHPSHSKEIMVGKHNEIEIIKNMLIGHPSRQREVVSIKGMAGIGKTTLARRVYEDPSMASHFDKRAWIVASQKHRKQQMLTDLCNSIDKEERGNDDDLALRIYQGLKGWRYLIVVDDVWSVDAWDDVKTCFPDDENGSRVLLTTRLAEVATHTGSNHDFSHQMHLLDQSESWNLFCEKCCKSGGAEFETIGIPVVDKCKGLPLAIIVIAGLFSKLNTLDEWKNTANALSSSSSTTLDDEECSRILSLSYNHLPYNLKACFLYLGVFPEDHEIKTNDLARLWFAEGFVNAIENESFGAMANRYIQELMDRNLIILSELSSCGRKIKKFRMHDLLHAFCAGEAQNENILHVVMSENSSNFPQKKFRWVSIQSVDFNMSTICPRSKSCRSYFCFLGEGLSLSLKSVNLLRVVYFHSIGYGAAGLKKLVDIVHLRFLKSRSIKNIELSRAGGFLKSVCRKNIQLSTAWNLQTLDWLKVSYRSDDGGNYSEFPQLQYVHCTNRFHGNIPKSVNDLSWLRADYCSKEYIMNISYLKKVGIYGKSRDCNDCIMDLVYIEQLERLCILGDNTETPINDHIVLLKNLRKLSFQRMSFEWKGINVLSKLPRLEVLKLDWMLNVGEDWEILEEMIFCQLISLYIRGSGLKHWKASSHNFPKLERLVLVNCHKLRKIPIDFVDIPTLKLIKLEQLCLPSAVMSAKQIQQGQHDYGNENMIVIEEDALALPKLESSEHESD